MILVTGAAGKTGQAVLQALAARQAAARALVRHPEQTTIVRETVVGDMLNPATWERAMSGVEKVYLICPNMHPQEVEIGRMAIAAAQAASISHFVYHSVLHPQTEAMPHHWHKLRLEEVLLESGLNFTILQPAAYMQNLLGSWASIVNEGVYRVPYPVTTRLSMVDLVDVAAAAAVVLTTDDYIGGTYELVGPEKLSLVEAAAVLSLELNRPVQAEEISLAIWQADAHKAGLGDYQIATLLKMFRYYAQYNFWGSAWTLKQLLRREPTSFADFIHRQLANS